MKGSQSKMKQFFVGMEVRANYCELITEFVDLIKAEKQGAINLICSNCPMNKNRKIND